MNCFAFAFRAAFACAAARLCASALKYLSKMRPQFLHSILFDILREHFGHRSSGFAAMASCLSCNIYLNQVREANHLTCIFDGLKLIKQQKNGK